MKRKKQFFEKRGCLVYEAGSKIPFKLSVSEPNQENPEDYPTIKNLFNPIIHTQTQKNGKIHNRRIHNRQK